MHRCRCLEGALALALALAAALALSPRAWAGDRPLAPEARVHVDRGLTAYGEKRYQEAIRELEAAYRLDARREILFNWAQAERLSGDCAAATPLYQKFLESRPPAAQAAQARRLIARCRAPTDDRESSTQPPSEAREEDRDEAPLGAVVDPWPTGEPAKAPPAPATPTPAAPAPADSDEEPVAPWYKDWVGGGLVAGGVLGLAVGVGFYARSQASFDDAAAASSWSEYGAAYEDGKGQRRVAVVGFVVGGGLIAGGVVRWVLVSQRGPTQAALAPLPGGAALVVGGRF